jgi:hypothetical protein
MTLLLDFLCRFGWGLAAALVLTSPAVVPAGFFRVNTLVIMGIATFAALLAGSVGPPGAWLVPALAAAAAWMGSVAWLGERRRAGMVLAITAATLLCLAVALFPAAVGSGASTWLPTQVGPVAGRLLSGLVTGLSVHAMLLGHWYLNAPGMRVDALRRAIDQAFGAWGMQAAVAVLAVGSPAVAPFAGGDATATALLALRWLAGLVGLPVLLAMARQTLAIPNTQSATGILYVACIAAILGELTAQLLAAA